MYTYVNILYSVNKELNWIELNVKETGSQNFALSFSPLKEGKQHFRHFRVLALKVVSIFLPSPKPNASTSNLINSAKFDGAAGSEIKKNSNVIWDAI